MNRQLLPDFIGERLLNLVDSPRQHNVIHSTHKSPCPQICHLLWRLRAPQQPYRFVFRDLINTKEVNQIAHDVRKHIIYIR